MKTKGRWSSLKIFLISVVTASIVAVPLHGFYKNLFGPVTGSLLDPGFPEAVTTYSGTLFLIYILVATTLYSIFSVKFRAATLVYFLIVPFVLFLSSGRHLLVAVVVLFTGLVIARFVKRSS